MISTRHRMILFVGSAVSSVILALAACDDGSDRPAFTGPPDALADVDVEDAPDTSPTRDGGTDARRSFDASDEPVACAVDPCATEIAAGSHHFCARMSDSTIRCWGDDEMGSLGAGDLDGGVDAGDRPVRVAGLSGVTQISAAGRTSCARLDDGSVHCWGANELGQLGLATDPPVSDYDIHPNATRADLAARRVAHVTVGVHNTCALLESGDVWCWGRNDRFQLGRDGGGDFFVGPGHVDVAGFVVTRIVLGAVTTFAQTEDGRLVTWGAVSGREGSLDPDPVPFPIPSLSDVVGVSVGMTHACVIAEGRVFCWGRNRSSSLCIGLPDDARLPTATSTNGADPQRVAVSSANTCARMTDGTIQCCGDDAFGQLGLGKSGPLASTFTKASAFEGRAVQVVVSEVATCALVVDGSVQCWGGNVHGELGQGRRDDDPHPTPVRVAF